MRISPERLDTLRPTLAFSMQAARVSASFKQGITIVISMSLPCSNPVLVETPLSTALVAVDSGEIVTGNSSSRADGHKEV
jgi:hypothetical protein